MASRKPATPAQIQNAFALLAAQSDIKVGDKVKILRTFKDGELGCQVSWDDDMAREVGKVYKVTDNYGSGEWELDGSWCWPFHVLEKVGEGNVVELKGSDYSAEISDDGKYVEVGCQNIEAASVLELADRIRKVQAAEAAKPKPATARRRTTTTTTTTRR